MEDINTLRADIIALQGLVESLTARLAEHERTTEATYATKAYVQTYVEHMIGSVIPVHDPFTQESSFIGYEPLDIDRVLRKFANIKGAYSTADIKYILAAYDDAAKQGNINPYIAVAQMVKETDWTRSWWSQRPRRNPAGIGVTGATSKTEPADKAAWQHDEEHNIWKQGYAFPDWKISAKAHIGHLLTYAYIQGALMTPQLELVASDPRSKAVSTKVRGTVKLLKDLDNRWAVPGVGYGRSIATLANALRT